MFLFKKKEKPAMMSAQGGKEAVPKVRLTVIPEVFYGGKDPVLHYEETVVNVSSQPKVLSAPPKPLPPKPMARKRPFSLAKTLLIVIPVLALAGGGVAWYLATKSKRATVTRAPQATSLPSTPPALETESVPEAEAPPEPEPAIPERQLVFPRILLADSADLDVDSLTDQEEDVFGTDSGVWDTDTDGYFDGQEVFNLYNPKGFAPVRLIDSGLIREYINPTWQYRVYYPLGWEAAPVDAKADHVLFSAISGDFIEVRAFAKEPGESFTGWFARRVADQQFSDLTEISNRFDLAGWKRQDELVAYFESESAVFVFIYQISAEAESVPFRNLMKMMYQSFRIGAGTIELPDQALLPVAPEFGADSVDSVDGVDSVPAGLLDQNQSNPQAEPDDFFAN